MRKFNIILFGPPGSGKGTQASMLVDRYQLIHISTGDLFRHEMGNKTALGLKAQEYMRRGSLVPDEITIGMLKNKVESLPNALGFIYDGFPRTETQAHALDNMLAESGQQIDSLVALDVSEDEVVRRLLKRGKTSGRTDDSDEEIIRKRYIVYKNETSPVFDHYKSVAHLIPGIGTVNEITARLFETLDQVLC